MHVEISYGSWMSIKEVLHCGLTWKREHPQLHTFSDTSLQRISWGLLSGLEKC